MKPMGGHGDVDGSIGEARERAEAAISDALAAVEAIRDNDTAMRESISLTEALRLAVIAAGELRAVIAVRMRESRRLSFAELGEIMGVTRARAAEIVRKGTAVASGREAKVPEPQPVVAAIVVSPLGVLVGRRNDGKPPWTFIAGEIEPGESPADAAVREVKEETGLVVAHGGIVGRRVHPKTGRTMIYMSARPTHGTDIFVGDEDELAEVRWVSLAEADELMQPYGMFDKVHAYLERALR